MVKTARKKRKKNTRQNVKTNRPVNKTVLKDNQHKTRNVPSLDALLTEVRSNPENIEAALALAEYYNNTNQPGKIIETLEPFEARYPFRHEEQRAVYNRLLAFGYTHLRSYLKAEKIAKRGIDEFPNGLDFYYALTYTYYAMREWTRANENGRRILDRLESCSFENPLENAVSSVRKNLVPLYNILGDVCLELKKYDEAEAYLNRSIEDDPGDYNAYLRLANMVRKNGNLSRAREIIERGLKSCRQINELRMLKKGLEKKATISACLMVKNEEELLPGCLDSIRNWVDEIIVVDTGSEDKTVEIAESYGAKVYHQPWENDFSKHRNYTIELATMDWVFIIDADERIYEEDVHELLIHTNNDDVKVISLYVYNVYGDNEDTVTFLNSPRLFRSKLNLRYNGAVHNQLQIPSEILVLNTKLRLKHLGYDLSPEKMRKKHVRTKTLLEEQLKENPENAFALYNYAQILHSMGKDSHDWNKYAPLMIESAGKAVSLTAPDKDRPVHLMCLYIMALAYHYIGDYDNAIKYSQMALEAKSNYLDALILLGYVYNRKEDFQKSNEYYHRYLKAQKDFEGATDEDSLILFHPASLTDAYSGLGKNALVTSDWDNARRHYQKILELNPKYKRVNELLGRIELEAKDYDKAAGYFEKQLETGDITLHASGGLAVINLLRDREEDFKKYDALVQDIAKKCDEAKLIFDLGSTYLKYGKLTEAESLINRALQLGYKDEKVNFILSGEYFKAGLFEKAIKYYERIIIDGKETPEIINDLGNCYFQLGQYENAERYYLKALDSREHPDIVWRNYGLTEARLGKIPKAINALEEYIKQNPNEVNIIHIIGDLHCKSENYPTALEYYEHYLRSKPDDPLAMYNLSECYRYMGHTDAAIMGYQRVLQLDKNFKPALSQLENIKRKQYYS